MDGWMIGRIDRSMNGWMVENTIAQRRKGEKANAAAQELEEHGERQNAPYLVRLARLVDVYPDPSRPKTHHVVDHRPRNPQKAH